MVTTDPAADGIAQALKQLRTSAGKSAAEVAVAVKKSRPYVSGVENGHIKPSVDYLRACEVFFDLPMGTLTTDAFAEAVNRTLPTVAALLESARLQSPPKPSGAEPTRERTANSPAGVRKAIEALLTTTKPPHEHAKLLLSTIHGTPGEATRRLPHWLTACIAEALENRWEVEHLVALGPDEGATTSDLREMVDLLALPGRYEPFTIGLESAPGFDVVAVPGHGVLAFGEQRSYWHEETGSDPGELMFAHARSTRRRASPLFIRYHHGDRDETLARYLRIANLEQQPGDYGIVTSMLSTFARPLEYWESDERRRWRHKGWIDERRATLEAFRSDATLHSYREIASESSLAHFVETGLFEGIDSKKHPEVPETERRLVLAHLITLISDPTISYELRLEGPDSKRRVTDVSWSFKEGPTGTTVLIYAGKVTQNVLIETPEPLLTRYFRRQFDMAWAQLGAEGRDSDLTLAWLMQQIDTLR